MASQAFVVAVVLVVSFASLAPTGGVQSPIPLVVEQATIMPKSVDGSPRQVIVVVRNAGTRVVEAWGIAGEVRYTDGTTRHIGSMTDAYATAYLPEGLRGLMTSGLLPQARGTLTPGLPNPNATAEPVDATAVPTFAIFEDNTAIGDEKAIAFLFERRRLDRELWRTADVAFAEAATQRLNEADTFKSVTAAIDSVSDEAKRTSNFVRLRQSLNLTSTPQSLERLRTEIAGRRAAAERHADRKK